MRSCGTGSLRRAFSSVSKKSPKHSISPGDNQTFRRNEVEEIAMSRMMGTITSQASATSSPGGSLIQATETSTTSTVTEDKVGKPVGHGKLNFFHHHHHQQQQHSQNNTVVVPKPDAGSAGLHQPKQAEQPKQEPARIIFDRGIFESLNQTNDILKRPGFDRVVASQILDDIWLVGVIDGHGHSPICAEYLAESFPVVIRLLLERPIPGSRQVPHIGHSHREAKFHLNFGALNPRNGTSHQGHQTKDKPDATGGDVDTDPHGSYYCEILKEAFKICSQEWDSSPQIKSSDQYRNSGAVALFALVNSSRQQIYMANAGDCRALVSQTTGRGYRFVHSAHRTDNVKERLRVLHQGGKIKSVQGVPRVGGSLIPTRVFGDVGLKMDFFGRLRAFLDPDPEIATVEVSQAVRNVAFANSNSKSSQCAFTVLASDGLWDTLSTESVMEICTEALKKNKSAEEIAQMLGTASMQSTDDDVSIVVLVW